LLQRLASCTQRLLPLLLLLLVGPALAATQLEVEISGVEGELLDNVRAKLSLLREQGDARLNDYRVHSLFRQAEAEVRSALEPFGYYTPQIEAKLDPQGSGWVAHLQIQPGEPVRVRHVVVAVTGAGGELPQFQNWRQTFPLTSGAVLRHADYEAAKGELLSLAARLGFPEAKLTERRIEVESAQGYADIHLTLASGPRYAFGEVSFSEVPLSTNLLRNYLSFAPGDPFDEALLSRLQRDLADSDYFQRVEVEPQTPDAATHTIALSVTLTMRSRTRWTAGVGFGTDTGPRITGGVERRWVNRYGHRFNASATLSGLGNEFATEYRIPLNPPQTDYFHVDASAQREETDTSTRDTATVAAGVSQTLDGWVRTASINYQEESFEVGGESERSTMLYPSLGWQRVVADDRIFPVRGWRIGLTTRAAEEGFGSSTDLLQVIASGKVVESRGRHRFIARLDAGASEVSKFDQLPVSMRFFAGGDQSVRGFAYNSIGPKDGDGDVIGGKYLLVGSFEYNRYFNDRYGAALFYDIGSAFNDQPDSFDKGVGAGLRVRLPFAVIRADIAHTLTADHWRFHLNIGPEL